MTNIKDLLSKAQATGISEGGGGGRFTPPEGDYVVKVIKTNHDVTLKGDPKIGLHLEVTDDGENTGAKWWDNIILGGSDKANALNFGKLKGLGCDEEIVEKLGDIASIATFLVDREAKASVKHRSYQDREGNTRQGVNTYFSRDVDSVDPAARAGGSSTPTPAPAAADEAAGRGW